MKLCIDCKWFKPGSELCGYHFADRPDYVHGVSAPRIRADWMRNMRSPPDCGPEARWFMVRNEMG